MATATPGSATKIRDLQKKDELCFFAGVACDVMFWARSVYCFSHVCEASISTIYIWIDAKILPGRIRLRWWQKSVLKTFHLKKYSTFTPGPTSLICTPRSFGSLDAIAAGTTRDETQLFEHLYPLARVHQFLGAQISMDFKRKCGRRPWGFQPRHERFCRLSLEHLSNNSIYEWLWPLAQLAPIEVWNSNLDTFWALIELHHANWEGGLDNPEPPRALVLGQKLPLYVSRPMGDWNAGRLQRPTRPTLTCCDELLTDSKYWHPLLEHGAIKLLVRGW